MPQIFRIGSYIVYFWSNEGIPLEPVHVHIAEGRASASSTLENNEKKKNRFSILLIEIYDVYKN